MSADYQNGASYNPNLFSTIGGRRSDTPTDQTGANGNVGVLTKEVGEDRRHPTRSERHRHRESDEPARTSRRIERDTLDIFSLAVNMSGSAGKPTSEVGQC